MICSKDLQRVYVKFFELMRNYIWEFPIVEILADVEVGIFDSFIDADKLRKDFMKLQTNIQPILKDDKELKEVTDKLKSLIDDLTDQQYADLYQVQETF